MTSTQPNSTPSSGTVAESGRPAHRDWIPPIPGPLQRLFDATPLVTYPPNELPYRSPAPNDLPTLHVFITEAGAARGLPSFNPSCLKWQVSCFPILGLRGPGSASGLKLRTRPVHRPGRSVLRSGASNSFPPHSLVLIGILLKCSDMEILYTDLLARSRCSTQPRPVYKPRLSQRLAPIPPASPHRRPSRRTATPPHTFLSSRSLRTTPRLFSFFSLCLLYLGPILQ